MIALGGAVYAALMGMNNYNKHHNFYSDRKEPYVEVYDPDGELVIRTNDDKVFF